MTVKPIQDTDRDAMHLAMLHSHKKQKLDQLYGIHWGDPQKDPTLKFFRDQYILPYLNFDHSAIEIGPGGGRWTRYLLSFRLLYAVDRYQELLDELAKTYKVPNLQPIRNSGADLPGIPDASIDFVFSFGVFVHLELAVIERYLKSLYPVVKNTANLVIQYSDDTKEACRQNPGFSKNNPMLMRQVISDNHYTILQENVTALSHSAVVRFCKAKRG